MQPFAKNLKDLFNKNIQNITNINHNISNELENDKKNLNFYKQQKIDLEDKLKNLRLLYNEQYLKIPPCNCELQNKIVKLKKIYYKKDEAKNLNYDEVVLKKQDIEQINETIYLIKNIIFCLNRLFDEGTKLCFILEDITTPELEYEFHFKGFIEKLKNNIVEIEIKLRELKGHIKALQSLANVADLFPEFETKNSKISAIEERVVNFLDLVHDMDFSKFKYKK